MLSQGNNIIDLLLGINPQAGQKSQAAGTIAGAPDQSFPDIFDLLFAGEKPQAAGANKVQTGSLLDFANMLSAPVEDGDATMPLAVGTQPPVKTKTAAQQAAVIDELPNVVTQKAAQTAKPAKPDFSMLFGLGDISEFDISGQNPIPTPDEAEPVEVQATDTKQAPDAAALLQQHGMIAGQNVRDLLAAKPVELETGNYRVVDVRVTDKQVILKVEPENDPGNQIKMTLPLKQVAELLSDSNSPRVADAAGTVEQLTRVKVSESEKTDAVKVQTLLSRLNLKELEVAKVNPTSTDVPDSPEPQKVVPEETINVKITATRSGEEVAIKLNMKAAEMHAVKQAEPKQVAAVKQDAPSVEEAPVPPKQTPKEPSINNEKNNGETSLPELDAERWAKQSRVDKLSDAGTSSITKPDQAHVSSFFDKVSGTRTMPEQQTTLPPVRFSLPDNITSALKTNTRSVMISIEPDNLGPAKLHLAMHNDALTARLTVESIHAKAAVESSLDQLTDQLARAGVKVHHVEVSVSGGDVGSNMFERRPVWTAKQRNSTQSIDRLFESSTVTPTPTMSQRPASYVRADGVNVFA